MRTKESEEEE